MIEFERTIGSSEAKSWYLNLSDDRGRAYGADLGLAHCTKIAVLDGWVKLNKGTKSAVHLLTRCNGGD